jgi:hypothetical protein
VSPLGLLGVDAPVVRGVVAILAGIVLGRSLRWYGKRLDERRPSEERELMQLRSRETMIVLVATAIPYATTIIVLIVLASFFLPAAALGGSAFVAVVVGFAAQRFLMDVMAGILIAFERWYAVGDFVMIEPSKAAGIVEQFGLRTTVLRALNGDRAYVPNSQIITAFWSLKGYRRYSIELLTTDPDEAQRAIEDVGRRGPAGARPLPAAAPRRRSAGARRRDVARPRCRGRRAHDGVARRGLAGRRAQGTVAQRVAAGGADRVHARRRNLVALRAPRSDQVMRVTARCPRLGVSSERGGYS